MAEETSVEPQEVETEEVEVDELSSMLDGKDGDENETEDVNKDEEEKENDSEKEEGKSGEVEESEKEAGEGEESEEKSTVEQLQGQLKDLRQMVRTSKRDLTITQAKLERLSKAKKAELDEDDEDEDIDEGSKKKEPLSTVEELQQSIAYIGSTRGASLDILLETMEESPKYKGIREVCSRENFDDIFEVIATEVSKNGNSNFDEALLEVELSVWNKANPYKYMYDVIKKYHPSYVKKKGAAQPGGKGKEAVDVKAPGTIANKGGDSNLKSGWTAKRIDDLSEDELYTVPKEIYDKYMKDELD